MLSDFGAARLTDATTSSETMAVTVLYAAPEVLEGAEATERSDVYSLGLTLLAATLGHHPFRDDDTPSGSNQAIGAVVGRICGDGIPDPGELGLPTGLAAVLACATARDPKVRYRSAERLADALAQVREAPDTIPEGTTTRNLRRGRGRRGAWIAAAAALVALAVGAWVLQRDGPVDSELGRRVTEQNGILGPLYEQAYATYVGMLDPGCEEDQNLVQLSIHAGPSDFARGVETPWEAVAGEDAGTFMSYMPCDTRTDEARYFLGATGRWFVVVAEFGDDQYEIMSERMRTNENSPSPDWTVDDDVLAALEDPEIYRGWAIIDQEAE